jgi:hypothetical protein
VGSPRDLAPRTADPAISHFIPSVELTGSCQDKLRKLDTLIVYLHELRARLSGDATFRPAHTTRVARSAAWLWFAAGLVIGAASVLLLLRARPWGL